MHEPFATWILEERPLTPEQRAALEAHLAQCETCRALDLGWGAARRALRHYPEVSPRPGYLARWQAYRAAQEQRRRRQALGAATLAAGGLVASLALSVALGLTPGGWLAAVLTAALHRVAQAQALWVALRALAAALPPWVVPTLLTLSLGTGALGMALWAWAMVCLPQMRCLPRRVMVR